MYMGEVNVAQEELNSFLTVAEDLKVKGLTQGNATTGGGGHHQESKIPRQETQQASKPKAALARAQPLPPPKRPRISQPPHVAAAQSYHQEVLEEEIQEVVPVKSEPRELPPQQSYLPEQHHEEEEQGTVALDESYAGDESYDYQYEETGYQDGTSGMTFAGDDSGKDATAAREDLINSHIIKDLERKLFTCTLCQFGAPSTHRVFCHLEAKHFQNSPVTYTCPYCGKAASSKNAMCLHISRNHKEEKANSSFFSLKASPTIPFY